MADNGSYSERVTFRLRGDQVEWIDKIAENKGCSRSVVMREIIGFHKELMECSLSQLLQGSPVEKISEAVPNPEEMTEEEKEED